MFWLHLPTQAITIFSNMGIFMTFSLGWNDNGSRFCSVCVCVEVFDLDIPRGSSNFTRITLKIEFEWYTSWPHGQQKHFFFCCQFDAKP